ncbi:MAG: twin-arginine translocase TatA/TatE family subunit [Pseudomonadota bacterium]|nr:twin-arginine translocase TatA/TatE family subunit [Pseudomonadota bacterium]MEC8545672.1 twin-arginine translocase TatA/TatE family subunit [Pseudomonadota bacterium]
MGISWVQILVVVVLVILLFGRGRISSLMGDIASGITSFRKGLREDVDVLDEKAASVIDNETDPTKTDKKS